jgi:hypothetical protein
MDKILGVLRGAEHAVAVEVAGLDMSAVSSMWLAAVAGDRDAFAATVGRYRRELEGRRLA